jgi:GTP pyrophosphokinase
MAMNSKSNANVNMILKYIDEHVEENLTTRDLARIAGYSEYHFIRIFNTTMNSNVIEYVSKRKLIKASESILNGDKIIDVAIRYGWQSHSGFTRAFKKEFGFSTSLLRAMKLMESLGGNAMNHVFLTSTKVGATKEELFVVLKEAMKENGLEVDQDILQNTYLCVCEAYEGITRYSGEEYVTHLLNVAIILAQLGVQEEVLLAGMFCDVTQKGVISIEYLKEKVAPSILKIVLDLSLVEKDFSTASEEVIMIKLAERLHNMRTIEFIDEEQRNLKAQETIELFMPLARKMKHKKLIDELNDLGMEYYMK